jgi:hypothetical protein
MPHKPLYIGVYVAFVKIWLRNKRYGDCKCVIYCVEFDMKYAFLLKFFGTFNAWDVYDDTRKF